MGYTDRRLQCAACAQFPPIYQWTSYLTDRNLDANNCTGMACCAIDQLAVCARAGGYPPILARDASGPLRRCVSRSVAQAPDVDRDPNAAVDPSYNFRVF